MTRRSLGIVLIAVGLIGLLGTASAFAVRSHRVGARVNPFGPFNGGVGPAACEAPSLPGQVVDVELQDMRGGMGPGMMGNGRMMNVALSTSTVPAGEVSFRVWNVGMMVHEFVVLPLPAAGAGTRSIGADGTVDETGSLGEASNSCGEGAGEGIAPGAMSWVTLHLAPGRYELICNLPGHYAAGMYAELDAT